MLPFQVPRLKTKLHIWGAARLPCVLCALDAKSHLPISLLIRTWTNRNENSASMCQKESAYLISDPLCKIWEHFIIRRLQFHLQISGFMAPGSKVGISDLAHFLAHRTHLLPSTQRICQQSKVEVSSSIQSSSGLTSELSGLTPTWEQSKVSCCLSNVT